MKDGDIARLFCALGKTKLKPSPGQLHLVYLPWITIARHLVVASE